MESVDYKNLRKNLPHPGDRLDRVENFVVSGMPDINFCGEGFESWIEQKSPIEPKRSTTPLFGSNHKISQDQANWMLRQCRAGGRCYILISTDKRWILIDGNIADTVNKMTVTELIGNSLWSTTKPVKKEEWNRLRATLTSTRQSPTSTRLSA